MIEEGEEEIELVQSNERIDSSKELINDPNELTVQSEIYKTSLCKLDPSKPVISEFTFFNPKIEQSKDRKKLLFDSDGDLILKRKNSHSVLCIEHHLRTNLQLVGLQVWRGALLLSDLMFHINKCKPSSVVLELGSGTGLTSIAASVFAKHVICTDIDIGGLLTQIRRNVSLNDDIIQCPISVHELDFYASTFSEELVNYFCKVDIVIAADVIYDDDLTDAFLTTLDRILRLPPKKTAYVAMEKRFVFTLTDLDTVAPCYEHFMQKIKSTVHWTCQVVPVKSIPQYFHYDRLPQLVVWKITVR